MKRLIAIFLPLIMVLGLSSCGSNDVNEVREALQGSWDANWTYSGISLSRYYTFKGNTYTTGGVAALGPLDTKTGTYEIKDSRIYFFPDDGSSPNDLKFKYHSKTQTITLWWNEDVQFTKRQTNEMPEDKETLPIVSQKKIGTYYLQSLKVYWWDDKEPLRGPSANRQDSSITVDDANLSEGTKVELTYFGKTYIGTVNKNGGIRWGTAPNIIDKGSEFDTTISKSGDSFEIVIEYLLLEQKLAVGVTLVYN